MAQAKRSPILGYNHNVKYRGVIFHVQTEDSGLLNPHLFTHLFHEGVIVSTRKLVYDAGSNEEAIKSLMQAQHKAVMKDLKKGVFDDKIDAYLGGTPGLEPRAGEDPAVAAAKPRGDRAQTEAEPPPPEIAAELDAGTTAPSLEIINEDLSEPIELPLKRPAAQAQPEPPPPEPPPPQQEPIAKARVSTAQKVSRSSVGQTPPQGSAARPAAQPAAKAPAPAAPAQMRSAGPPIDITEDEISSRLRAPRDTAVESQPGDADMTVPVRTHQDRAAQSAAALPPSKPAMRPAMSPPVVTRPSPDAPRKRPGDSEAVEIYQPAPPSVEPPPGERSERAGTYSVSRKSGDAPIREKTGRIAAINPASLGLDSANKSQPVSRPGSRPGGGTGDTGANRAVPQAPMSGHSTGSVRVPQGVPREASPGTPTQNPASTRPSSPPPPPAGRPSAAPQAVRPSVTAPIANRTATPVNPQANSGVVMTRPAVIVGQPPKAPTNPTQQRVRKAREDEGRGFGQGLISEKSLDEVILAYLSEDAEDK